MRSDRGIIVDSLGVGIATGTYGVSFGAISTASGLSVLQTCVISLLVFTGASQFAFVGIIASAGNPLTGALTAVLLGSRNLFYGVSLAPKLELDAPGRLASAHFVIDESTAMGVTRTTRRQARLGFYWTGISIFLLWNLMTFVGALAGEAIGDPRTYGLDAAVGAAFLGLLWPRLATWQGRLVALIGAAVALGLVPLTSAGLPIILGGGTAVLVGLLWKPREAA
ncbi:MAG: branched-chain amino acid transporter permease [Aeromicrobium sp.]|jgi:4-azaleucine resistance transporter AzlC|uniref:AzlC family ABC transporter permease n=1 Tax=Aeromicrobium sp. TaxID=1871063 RepID=UPI00261532E6|nr:AzlC family ABC transporter permease [Aeromicrobium sp.]MCW2788253.1 branched-chain amino acid transporter permease [Aeromicrobium sp.]MCW2826091.1 branched-chain amino acid transporter permease [Aeromicrobium sp.]